MFKWRKPSGKVELLIISVLPQPCHRSAHRGSTWFHLSRCKDRHYSRYLLIIEQRKQRKVHFSLLSREKIHWKANYSKDIFSFRGKFVSLPSVRGEIRTNEAFAIISRIAKKSVGNSDWYNKHGNNKWQVGCSQYGSLCSTNSDVRTLRVWCILVDRGSKKYSYAFTSCYAH